MSLDITVVEHGAPTRQTRGLGSWLAKSAPKSARGQLTIAIVADRRMRALNRQFRGKDRATDVLSFPADRPGKTRSTPVERSLFDPPIIRPKSLSQNVFLGEIVIAGGLARRQAHALGHPIGTELRILALHGLLHLLGYDHDVDKGQMARAEARWRRRTGLPEGLIARSS